jgi:hypothetical protein
MVNEVLGKCACPLCGFPNQEVRQTSKTNPKPYLCCEDCHAQIFARGAKAARILKGRIVVQESDHMYSDESEEFNAARAVVAAKPAPIPQPAPTPPEAPKPKSIWDFG